ncbi:hypothetical protein, partial [Youngiibacter multivorans]|uniref:hypothetical protein n=1 Tax=Youngiibacter multivorans TaxID=937251 RepID=UPI001AE1515C
FVPFLSWISTLSLYCYGSPFSKFRFFHYRNAPCDYNPINTIIGSCGINAKRVMVSHSKRNGGK